MIVVYCGIKINTISSQLKEEANSRLSGLCFDTPQKTRGHKRLESAVDRLHKQNNEIRDEVEALRSQKADLEMKTHELVNKIQEPAFQPIVELHNTKLAHTEYKFKVYLTA